MLHTALDVRESETNSAKLIFTIYAEEIKVLIKSKWHVLIFLKFLQCEFECKHYFKISVILK